MEILFEDDAVIVINKPAGLFVHPAPGHPGVTMTDELVRLFPAMRAVGSAERPGVVHRLDQETSGVMVFAKTQAAYLDLRRQFELHRTIEKTYLAVCYHTPRPASGTIDSPVGRDRLSAVTHYRLLGRHNGVSLIEFKIETGRMHQIRLHAKELGCPVVGDKLYGDKLLDRRRRVPRLLLHAVELSFRHPTTRARVTFSAPPPRELVYV